jgi:DNA-binding transcriptional LysR family regulator
LAPLVGRFLNEHPNASVTLHEDSSVNIIDLVSRHQYDIGLAYAPTPHPGVEVQPLPVTEAVCVVPKGHRLAARKEVHVRDLEGSDFIRLGSSSLLRHQILKVMEAANVHCADHIEVRYAATACTFVSRGLGVSVVDPFTVWKVGQAGLVVRPFRPRIPYEFSVVLAAWRPRSRLVDDFVAILRDHLIRDFG